MRILLRVVNQRPTCTSPYRLPDTPRNNKRQAKPKCLIPAFLPVFGPIRTNFSAQEARRAPEGTLRHLASAAFALRCGHQSDSGSRGIRPGRVEDVSRTLCGIARFASQVLDGRAHRHGNQLSVGLFRRLWWPLILAGSRYRLTSVVRRHWRQCW